MVGYNICDVFWNRYFGGVKDDIDIFELINASISVASIERRNEFLSRRMDIIHCILQVRDEYKPRNVVNQIQEDETTAKDEFANAQNKKRRADCDDHYSSNVKGEKKKRLIENENGNRGVDYDVEFEVARTRFVERNQKIQREKRRVQILEVAPPPPPPEELICDRKPRHWFGSRIRKSRF